MPSQSSKSTYFDVTPATAGLTLTAALREWLADASWSEVRKLVRTRRVLVNHALSLDEGRRLAAGEVVEIAAAPLPPPPLDEDVIVQYLDDAVVVVEKPAGMTTLRHATERSWPAARKALQPTLDEATTRIIGRIENAQRRHQAHAAQGKPVARVPHVRSVHRLDRDTSGLLVFARTPWAETALVEQFAAHTVERVYLAVVAGHPKQLRFESHLVRDRGDGLRGSAPKETPKATPHGTVPETLQGTTQPETPAGIVDADLGKHAVTHIALLERLGPVTLIECRLETGRTHQIRIHLSEHRHPVLGDQKYGDQAAIKESIAAPRLALHAAQLGFKHPSTGEQLHFEMPLPKDLERFLDWLRTQHSR